MIGFGRAYSNTKQINKSTHQQIKEATHQRMNKSTFMKYLLIITTLFFHVSCKDVKKSRQVDELEISFVNTAHLDRLYVPVIFPNGTKAAGIYIYAEAPDYRLIGDEDEGFTCVDDVARAVQVYIRSKTFFTDTAFQSKAANLIRFILEMQSRNGYFYNFLFPDGQINTKGKTSINNANWWSWRALQTLTEGSPVIKKINLPLGQRMDSAISRLITNIKRDLVTLPSTTARVAGLDVPQYFPAGSASDQASIILISLVNYCSENEDDSLRNYIHTLAAGIMKMQHGDKNNFPYACFLSWENVWHAYGNDQAYALLRAGKYFKDSNYILAALKEINFFYPWLVQQEMLSSFSVEKKKEQFIMNDTMQFAQIAYGIRPMISATLEAYDITGDKKFASLAQEIISWFFGKNLLREKMYDKETGRCYDGLVSANKINKNAGAESTIEALLALQLMEKHNLLDTAFTRFR